MKWANELVIMTEKELALKRSIVDDLQQCEQKETLLVYASAWLMQPYLDERRYSAIVESLKAEYTAA